MIKPISVIDELDNTCAELVISTGGFKHLKEAYLVVSTKSADVQIRVNKQDLIDVLEKLKQEEEK